MIVMMLSCLFLSAWRCCLYVASVTTMDEEGGWMILSGIFGVAIPLL